MSSTISAEEVSSATESLLKHIGAAQRAWIRSRAIKGVGEVERIATYCALRALTNAFPLEAVVEEPESMRMIREFADNIRLTTASADELKTDLVRA